MPVVSLSDLPGKIPEDNDLVLIESGGNLYRTTVADMRPPFTVLPPFDLGSATDPVYLLPGQGAYVRFQDATHVELPVVISDDGVYRVIFFFSQPTSLSSSTTPITLLPNYVGVSGGFSYYYTTARGYSGEGTLDGLALGIGYSSFISFVYAKPNSAKAATHGSSYLYGSVDACFVSSMFSGGTLSWSIMGRLTLPTTMSGIAYLRREV